MPHELPCSLVAQNAPAIDSEALSQANCAYEGFMIKGREFSIKDLGFQVYGSGLRVSNLLAKGF
jgi:hypothetical protein